MSDIIINAALLAMLATTAFLALRLHHLFSVVILSGAFSLIAAALFIVLDGVDVAFTEAAVGAGFATMLALAALRLVPITEKPHKIARIPAGLAVVTGLLLAVAITDLPRFGDPDAPIHTHVAPDYITGTKADIGIPNVVTAVLASYRGYDTLGEVVVIFTACIGVMLILSGGGTGRTAPRHAPAKTLSMHDDPVMRVVSKVLIPTILLFALYVQFHGDFGPGGGFQAGVIFAAAFILNAIIFGFEQGRNAWPPRVNMAVLAAGVLLYGGTGLVAMLMDGAFLDYDFLRPDPRDGQHLGILLVELGVGMTVAASMVALFFAFTEWRLQRLEED